MSNTVGAVTTSNPIALSGVYNTMFPSNQPINSYNMFRYGTVNNAGGTWNPLGYISNYFGVGSGGSGDQMQMVGAAGNHCQLYYQQRIQDNYSFTLTFQFYCGSGSQADGWCVYFGATTPPYYEYGGTTGGLTPTVGGMTFNFQVYNGTLAPGIHLIDYNGTVQGTSATTSWINAGAWETVTITYTQGTVGTWVLNYNGSNVISYSDSGNQNWLSTLSGSYWGFVARCGGLPMYLWLGNINMQPETLSNPGNARQLCNPLNWYTKLTANTVSGSAPNTTGSDPFVTSQMLYNVNGAYTSWTNVFPIQTQNSFVFSFALNTSSASADLVAFIIGSASTMSSGNKYSNGGGWGVQFVTWSGYSNNGHSGTGIYLVNSSDVAVAYSSYTSWINGTANVVIQYTKGATSTWIVYVNNVFIFAYSDAGNPAWVLSSIASGYTHWGVYASTGGLAMNASILYLEMSYVPDAGSGVSLVTTSNWVYLMSTSHFSTGSFNVVLNNTTTTNSSVYAQLCQSGTTSNGTNIYHIWRVQDYTSFTMSFNLDTSSVGADYVCAFFGASSAPSASYAANNGWSVVCMTWSGYSNNGYSGQGIYLMNTSWSGTTAGAVAYSSNTSFVNNNAFNSQITVIYTKGTTNTWVIQVNGTTVITYSDSSNASWVSSTSGSYWGISGFCGGLSMYAFIQSVYLTYNAPMSLVSSVPNATGPLSLGSLLGRRPLELGTFGLATDNGAYNTSPWNNSIFPDTSARFIWNTSGSTSSAPGNIYIDFQCQYYNSGAATSGLISFACDDYVSVFHNQQLVAYNITVGGNGLMQRYVMIQSGNNMFDFIALNGATGPAGLIFSLYSYGTNSYVMRSVTNTGTVLANQSKVCVAQTSTAMLYPISSPFYVSAASFLALGGGGGGGQNAGGGGGAGGFVQDTFYFAKGATYTITIGGGGGGQANGGNTTVTSAGLCINITAVGGGAGGNRDANIGGQPGGCGGGGGTGYPGYNPNGSYAGATSIYGQGYPGANGSGTSTDYNVNAAGGGGGGCGGGATVGAYRSCGTGGAGVSSSITGSAITYGGGGGGANYSGGFAQGVGGSGGGGGGNVAGTNGLGGGGGGNGQSGGSGVFIFSIPTATYTGVYTNATVSTSGSNTILKFTSSGTYNG